MTKLLDGVAGSVRPLRRDDIPAICALFSRTFRPGARLRHDDLAAAIADTYMTAPAYRPERGSLVHVGANGRLDGFMGIINITLQLGDRLLQAGVMSAYMADHSVTRNAVGLTLVRAARRLPLDLIFSDTANRTSLEMSRPLQFAVLPLQSLEWTKVLRPAGTASYLLSRRRRWLPPWLGRPAGTFDRLLSRPALFQVNTRPLAGATSSPISIERFVDGAAAFLDPSALRPAWDRAELTWLVTQASRQSKNGALQLREVRDRGGRVVGMYLFYGRRGGIASTLQLLAEPSRAGLVVADLLDQARQLGAVAVKGAAAPAMVEGLMRQDGVIYRHVMSCVAWTSDPAVAAAIHSGHALLGGLAGETWARIFSDAFV